MDTNQITGIRLISTTPLNGIKAYTDEDILCEIIA